MPMGIYIIWTIINIFLTLLSISSFTNGYGDTDGFRQILASTIVMWGFWVAVVWLKIITPLKMEKRHKYFEENELPRIRAKELEDCKQRQKELGLPTQEVLEEIADKFGFTLHGEFAVGCMQYLPSRFEIETHKSLEELTQMGINTFKDIFGNYYLFFRYNSLRFKLETERDEYLNACCYQDKNNVIFTFSYNPRYEDNIDVKWDKDYIIQIKKNPGYDNKGYTVYRDSGMIVRENVDELTENEKTFIITAKDVPDVVLSKGTMRGGFWHIGEREMFQICPDEPLLLE